MPRPVLVLLALLPSLTIPPAPEASVDEEALVPKARRKSLAALVDDVASLGKIEYVEQVNALLLALGESADEQQRREKAWRRALEKAPEELDPRDARKLSKRLAKQGDQLAKVLDDLQGEPAAELARLVLELDSSVERAHEELGHVPHEGGWTTSRALELAAGSAELEGRLSEARRLEVPVVVSQSENPTARMLLGDEALQGVWGPFEIHIVASERVVQRRVRSMVQGAALMESLTFDRPMQLPTVEVTRPVIVCSTAAQFERGVADAVDNARVTPEEADLLRSTTVANFHDGRGWTVMRPQTEARVLADTLWLLRFQIVGYDPQAALSDGLLNWISLRFAGAHKAIEYWQSGSSDRGGSTTESGKSGSDVLWHVATSTMAGCREWMLAQLEAGRSFRFARSLVAETGQLEAEPLMVATLVTEYLIADGRFATVLDDTRKPQDRTAEMEAALGTTLPEFDSEWIDWMRGDATSAGLVQTLAREAVGSDVDPAAASALEHLRAIRDRAFRGRAPVHELELFESLSAGAAAHARYLVDNPEQQTAWPDAHEEWVDAPGFSVEGARAGLSSVIAFDGDSVRSIDAWMGTFYHRLPLLERYLYGIGVGTAGNVVVLDAGSLGSHNFQDEWIVWPPRGGKDMPRRFAAELPNPVPGEDQSSWGYPITLQFGHTDPKLMASFELSLADAAGSPVECWFLRPDAPFFAELAPPDAWCLIPKQPLAAGQRYSVTALRTDTGDRETWSFETAR